MCFLLAWVKPWPRDCLLHCCWLARKRKSWSTTRRGLLVRVLGFAVFGSECKVQRVCISPGLWHRSGSYVSCKWGQLVICCVQVFRQTLRSNRAIAFANVIFMRLPRTVSETMFCSCLFGKLRCAASVSIVHVLSDCYSKLKPGTPEQR